VTRDALEAQPLLSRSFLSKAAALPGCREIAWLVIEFRIDKGLSQQQQADLVRTSNAEISPIESGRHRTNLDTFTRIAQALGVRLVVGFETLSATGDPRYKPVAF
jgi:transcriptional regulator with XRE-family HTH domain